MAAESAAAVKRMNVNGSTPRGELPTKGGSLPTAPEHDGRTSDNDGRRAGMNSNSLTSESDLIRNYWGKPSRDEAVRQFLRDALTQRFSKERGVDASASLTPNSNGASDPAAACGSGYGVNGSGDGAEVSPLPANRMKALPWWKRTFDLGAIVLTLPLWLPVMLLVMLAVRLSSQGPIFFKQRRIGYRGRTFMIYKFRSMRVNAETQSHESHFERLMRQGIPMAKLDAAGDPRIIPWGRFIRATGLDELPQLFNVLRGEMSLVGPRPCTAHEFEHFTPYERQRADAFPGLTGYWQVNGKNRTTFDEMIELDIYYARNVSLSLDLKILVRTIPTLICEARGIRTSTRLSRGSDHCGIVSRQEVNSG
jgi:lipopolysaccharide/colanic/teichoic acid biosynthesis glycosyltransferase